MLQRMPIVEIKSLPHKQYPNRHAYHCSCKIQPAQGHHSGKPVSAGKQKKRLSPDKVIKHGDCKCAVINCFHLALFISMQMEMLVEVMAVDKKDSQPN